MATHAGFDPASPLRQSGRLARCVMGLWCARGDLNSDWIAPQAIASAVGLHARKWQTTGGSNSARQGLRGPRSTAELVVYLANPGGYDPLATGLKGRCLSIRLYARGPGPRLSPTLMAGVPFTGWCKPAESNRLPLGYRPRPSPFGLACVGGASSVS